ncbi:MAG: hypothetical protein ACJAUV_000054 [Flavobacteriales bacterium]|jgi:hypothetical protein
MKEAEQIGAYIEYTLLEDVGSRKWFAEYLKQFKFQRLGANVGKNIMF